MTWICVLHANEHHFVADVVRRLMITLSCDVATAYELATLAATIGQAMITVGTHEECNDVRNGLMGLTTTLHPTPSSSS